MSVRITEITGPRGFFRAGDEIVSIDGRPVEDQLDLYYRLAIAESSLVEVRRHPGRVIMRRLRSGTIERAGLVLEPMRFKTCSSRCIFCFVDQMPPGMRETLYCKDDDYRLSFLYGNYITLNDIRPSEIDRIVELHLSPLYVSVHATGERPRRRLFGRPMRRDIMEPLSRLTGAGITVHAQIVLVPGINDGKVLEQTIDDLAGLFPGVKTLAIVPVGLTSHREGLERIEPVGPALARNVLDLVRRKTALLAGITAGEPFLHCSDEFYLLSGRSFPEARAYGAFEQLSNGVGMCRLMIDGLIDRAGSLAKRCTVRGRMTLATGRLGARLLRRHILPAIRRTLPGLRIDLLPVRNRLFGRSVGVSGLLAGADIIAAARRRKTGGCLVLPPNAVNHEGVLIDDMRPSAVASILGKRVVVPRHDFLENAVLRSCSGRDAR